MRRVLAGEAVVAAVEVELRARQRRSSDALKTYRRDPLAFCVEVLGIAEGTLRWSLHPGYGTHHWDGTVEPIVALLEGLRDGSDVGVEAGTGTQKSFTAACAVLWFLSCWEGARVFTFAPKEDQLRLFIWMEIKKLWPRFQERFPAAELTDLCLRVRGGTDDSWGARGYAVGVRAGEDVATKAQGMHAEHMLLIYEETPGIDPAIVAAGEHTSTAPHNLRLFLGNPDHQLDTLHVACSAPGVRAIRISALDHPNIVTGRDIVPGAVSIRSVERRRALYGAEHRLFQARVRGLSPAESTDALITLAWVLAAQAAWRDRSARAILECGPKALGVDVANSEAGDEAAISRWTGAVCREVVSFPCPNANDLGFRVAIEMEDESIEDEHVGVDAVGVGAGTVNKLREREKFVSALNGGARPQQAEWQEEQFNNLRSEMWWTLREDLRLGRVALPPDDELATDLTAPCWETRNGKIVVESKETIRGRLPHGRSPNKGDACVYGNFVRSREPVASEVRPRVARTLMEREREQLRAEDPPADVDEYRYSGVLRQG